MIVFFPHGYKHYCCAFSFLLSNIVRFWLWKFPHMLEFWPTSEVRMRKRQFTLHHEWSHQFIYVSNLFFSWNIPSLQSKTQQPQIIFSHLYYQSEKWGQHAIRKCHRKIIQIYWVLLVVWQKINLGVCSTVHEGIMRTHSRGEYFPGHISDSGLVLQLR